MSDNISSYDIKSYVDKYQLVQPDTTGRTSENGIRFTAESILAGIGDRQQLFDAILGCELFGNSEGLLQRYPGCKTQDSFDNYIAAMAASYLCDGGKLAGRIWTYGKKNFGFYCNNGFVWNAFLWRSPSFVGFSRFCATGNIGLHWQAVLAESFRIAANSKEQDSKILSWFMVRCLKGKYKVVDKAIEHWKTKLKEHYPRGIGNVLGEYYGYDHPNSMALMDVFE